MPEPDFSIKRGDTASPIYATLEDSTGAAVDISSASIIFRLGPVGGGTLVVDDFANNDQVDDGSDGSLGQVSYQWDTALTEPGLFVAEWEVTYASGSVETFPNGGYNLVLVTPDL